MPHSAPFHRRVAAALLITGLAGLAAQAAQAAQAEPKTGETVRIFNRDLVLPSLSGMAPACAEHAEMKRMMAATLPADGRLVGCWVGEKGWKDMQAGNAQAALYPIVTLFYSAKVADRGGRADFETAMRELRKQLPSLLKQAEQPDQLRRNSEQMNKQNVPITTQSAQVRNEGIFDETPDSLSYLVFRETTSTVAGRQVKAKEALAVTMLFHRGIGLALTVVEQGATPASSLAARQRSLDWLKRFRAANPGT